MTSHDVVAAARRAYGERSVGHAGTLDPFATGLLILLLGRATRLLPYLDAEPKVYEATIRFGAETDTDDLTGALGRQGPLPTRQAVEREIRALTGTFEQAPPAYSAKKIGGRRAYDAARAGAPVTLAPVPVTVHAWESRDWRENELDVTIICGGGTYIRALARDLGRRAGSAAHLAALRRTTSGSFSVNDAVSLDVLREGRVAPLPPLAAVRSLPAVTLAADEERRIRNGQRIDTTFAAPRVALVDTTGDLVAVADHIDGQWQPRVVLADA